MQSFSNSTTLWFVVFCFKSLAFLHAAFGKNRKKDVSKTREILTDGCMGGGGGQGKKKLFSISFKNSEKTEIK